MGRVAEYEVKKERLVLYCHPKTIKAIKKRAKIEKSSVGKLVDTLHNEGKI